MEFELVEKKETIKNAKLKGLNIESLVDKKFLSEFRKGNTSDEKIFPIGLIFIKENMKKKKVEFLVLNHETRKDLLSKQVDIDSDTEILLKAFLDSIKKV